MKNLIYFLLMPILVLAQPITQLENEITGSKFSIDLFQSPALAFNDGIHFVEEHKTFQKTSKSIALKAKNSEFSSFKPTVETPPEYLSTLSLIVVYSTKIEQNKPQERLNRLLASNDMRFPKENTFVNWLKPVRYTQNLLVSVKNMPKGFGPIIRI